MREEMKERIKEEDCNKCCMAEFECNRECCLSDIDLEDECYIPSDDAYCTDDSFYIDEECPFYDLITEDFPVIDDGDENNPISNHTEKRPIAEYCNLINDYSFNCCGCSRNK